MNTYSDYVLNVYAKDRRSKSGERLKGTYNYKNVQKKWMEEEVKDLYFSMYPKSKYRLEVLDKHS